MKKVYILLAVLGIVLPYWAMFASIIVDQYTVQQFFSAWFENNAVRMMAADLGVAAITFSSYIVYKFQKGKGPNPLKYFVLMFGVGLSFAMPIYFLNLENKKNLHNNRLPPTSNLRPSRTSHSEGLIYHNLE